MILMSQIRAYLSQYPARAFEEFRGEQLNLYITSVYKIPGVSHRPYCLMPECPGSETRLGAAVRFSTLGGVMQDVSFLGATD